MTVRATVIAQSSVSARLAIDTGATISQLSTTMAQAIGLNLSAPLRTVRIVTGSGVISAPVVHLPRLRILGIEAVQLEVVVSNLPALARLDGLVGLNFFVNHNLYLNYGRGILLIHERQPRSWWQRIHQMREVAQSLG